MRIETVEFLRASRDAALVRLAGTWPNEGEPPAAALVVEAGGEAHRFAALPAGPGGAPGGWGAGFSVPAALVESDEAVWRLELGDEVLELPRPARAGARSEERRVGKECRSRWHSSIGPSSSARMRRPSRVMRVVMRRRSFVSRGREIGRASCRERV